MRPFILGKTLKTKHAIQKSRLAETSHDKVLEKKIKVERKRKCWHHCGNHAAAERNKRGDDGEEKLMPARGAFSVI